MSVAEVLLRLRTQGVENVEDAARALRDVEEQAQRTEAAQDALNESAGRVGAGAQKMAGALSLVAPAGGEAARTLADLADVVEVATEAAAGLNVGWGALAAGAAAVGLALSPLVLLWQDYSAVQEQATAAAEAWNRVQDSSLPLVDRAYQSVRALNLEVSGLTDAEREQAKIALNWDAALAQANATVQEELDLARGRLAQLGPSKAGYVEAAQAVAALEAQLQDNADTAAKGMRADQLLAEVRRETAEANRALEERERSLTEAREVGTSATEAALKAEQAELDAINKLIDSGFGLDLAATSAELAAQEVDAALADIRAGVESVGEAARDTAEELGRMGAAAQAAGVAGLVSSASGTLQTATTGSVGSLAQSVGPAIGTAVAGPVGAAVGSAIGDALAALEALGAAGGAAGVQANLQESLKNISLGIEALPELLASVFPDLVSSLVAEFVPALIRLQGQLFVELQMLPIRFVQGFVQAFDSWWTGIGGFLGMVDALKEWWTSTWEAIKDFVRHPFGNDRDGDGKTGGAEVRDTVKDAISYLMTGSYAVGSDYIPRTGLALVHQGERITPANMRAAQEGGGGDVHIHLQGFSIGTPDQLVRELNRVLGDNGRRLAWRS